jgi:hypothetical protein
VSEAGRADFVMSIGRPHAQYSHLCRNKLEVPARRGIGGVETPNRLLSKLQELFLCAGDYFRETMCLFCGLSKDIVFAYDFA